MKGDFTRVTFEPRKRYTSVRMQQGRVQLDSDWNEQADIQGHLDRTEATDVIGRAGAPRGGDSFRIGVTPDGADLTIAPGRFYVDGRLCELAQPTHAVAAFPSAAQAQLERWPDGDGGLQSGRWVELGADDVPWALNQVTAADEATRTLTPADDLSAFIGATNVRLRAVLTYTSQPDHPAASPLSAVPSAGRTDLVYLDAWEQEVSANEDPELLEPALGGADTATRTRTVWQVRVREGVTAQSCSEIEDLPSAPADGVLSAAVTPSAPGSEPCLIPPAAAIAACRTGSTASRSTARTAAPRPTSGRGTTAPRRSPSRSSSTRTRPAPTASACVASAATRCWPSPRASGSRCSTTATSWRPSPGRSSRPRTSTRRRGSSR